MFIVKVPGINSEESKGCERSGEAIIKELRKIHTNEQGKPIDVDLLNLEEIHLDNSNLELTNKLIYENATQIFDTKPKTIFLGGDGSISFSVLRAFRDYCMNKGKNPCLIVFDAHADCMPILEEKNILFTPRPSRKFARDIDNEIYSLPQNCSPTPQKISAKPSYSSNVNTGNEDDIRLHQLRNGAKFPTNRQWLRALIEHGFPPENALLVGVRNINNNEGMFLKDKKIKMFSIDSLTEDLHEACDTIMEFTNNKEVYISIDIDAIDPAFAPSVNSPEPCGLNSRDFLHIIKRLNKIKNLKALDIVEINGQKDMKNNGSTIKLGAKILSEII